MALREVLLCGWCSGKPGIFPSKQPYEVGAVTIPVLWIKEPRLREGM